MSLPFSLWLCSPHGSEILCLLDEPAVFNLSGESVAGKANDFFLLYIVINQFRKFKVMVPIIHTSIIGTMEIYRKKDKMQEKK